MKKIINSLLVFSIIIANPLTVFALDEIETNSSYEEVEKEGTNDQANTKDQTNTNDLANTNDQANTNDLANTNDQANENSNEEENGTEDEISNRKDTRNETNETGSSRWETDQPKKLTTSEGIIVDFSDVDNWHLDYSDWEYKGIKVIITIPEDYEEDKIVLAPEIFDKIAEILQDNPEMYVEPGDKFVFDIEIKNLSKYTYNYDEGSFVVIPKENIVYTKLVEQEKTGGNAETYNGKTINENYHFFRYYNTALKELLPGKNYRTITDSVINDALIEKGYNGIDDLGKYYLDFYNNKYQTNYTNLDQFPDGIIREMLYNVNPLTVDNSALASLGIYYARYGENPTYDKVLSDINSKQSDKVYTSIEDFYLDYYNEKYNTSATKFADLSDDALDDFYSSTGRQDNGRIIESNNDIDVLSYNYFYNKGLAFGFDNEYQNDIIKSNGKEHENYSIGEYSRNKSLGDAGVKANAATLNPNSTSVLPNNFILLNGEYLVNSFQIYEFNVELQFTYSALKGNVIAKYVDIDTLEEIESREETSGMVGKDYSTFKKDINGYEYVTVDGEVVGTYINGTIYVTYYYTQNTGDEGEKEPTDDKEQKTPPKTDMKETSIIAILINIISSIFIGIGLIIKYI